MLRAFSVCGCLILLLVLGCGPNDKEPTPRTEGPAGTESSLPDWVGTAVFGENARSDKRLPAGITNGDIIEGDGLLWFTWENTKSRIWMPYAGPDGYLSDLAEGRDATGTLVGVTADGPANQWEIAVRTTDDARSIQQVFLVDRAAGVKYTLQHKVLGAVETRGIPTAYEYQYYPALPE